MGRLNAGSFQLVDRRSILAPVLVFALAGTEVQGSELWIGAATADITPDEPVPLTGYASVRISEEHPQPLHGQRAGPGSPRRRQGRRPGDPRLLRPVRHPARHPGGLPPARGRPAAGVRHRASCSWPPRTRTPRRCCCRTATRATATPCSRRSTSSSCTSGWPTRW